MMKRTILVSFFVVITAVLLSFVPKKESGQKVLKTIVVDAGHGLVPGWWS